MNDQIYVKTLEVAGIASALQAMRLPMKSGDKSDSTLMCECMNPAVFYDRNYSKAYEILYSYGYDDWPEIIIGKNDLKLLQKLIRSGDEHAKVMRGIIVWCEYAMPRYMHQEIDTYTIGMAPLSSESSMHVEAKGLKDEELVQFKENLKEGHIQKRIRAFSYQSLRHMYFQRKNHRLPAWREIIVPWIENLPLANELITINPWWQDRINELEKQLEELKNGNQKLS